MWRRICRTICELCVGANTGAVIVIASAASASWFIGRLESADLQPRWGKRLADASMYIVSVTSLAVAAVFSTAGRSAKETTAPTLPLLATYVASSITMWFAMRRYIDAYLKDLVYYMRLLGYEERTLRDFLLRSRRSWAPEARRPPVPPGVPHPRDPRVDDNCPICCDDLACVGLTLLVDGARDGVRAQVAERQLSKCRRCGSVAHTECVFEMMIASAGGRPAGNNPCAVCR